MIVFHSFHVAPRQDYLHSIHFHSFPLFYFKTSNQNYLISFNSIHFHSFIIIQLHSIPFPSLMNSQAKPNECWLYLKYMSLISLHVYLRIICQSVLFQFSASRDASCLYILKISKCHYHPWIIIIFTLVLSALYYLVLIVKVIKAISTKFFLFIINFS